MDCSKKKVFVSFELCLSSEVMSYNNIGKHWPVTDFKKATWMFFWFNIYLFINIQENNASEFLANKLIFLYLGFFFFYIKQLKNRQEISLHLEILQYFLDWTQVVFLTGGCCVRSVFLNVCSGFILHSFLAL